MRIVRALVIVAGLLLAWQVVVWLTAAPHFILPGPARVALAWGANWLLILEHAGVTLLEIVLGLALGTLVGCVNALALVYFRPARLWLLPVLVSYQAVPVFALAPILALWFGFGIASKVVMAALIIYFPVAASFFDGLRRTEPGWLDLAHTMNGGRWAVLRHVRVPAALPCSR